ncbi:MAG: hypothetical protein JSS63_02310 [Bacteroidetes bacterium]|nr:hypothetical protein [Bacteroidota bacterium]
MRAQGVYDYYLATSSPPFYVIIKNTLGKAWKKQHETLKKNKVKKIEVYESEKGLWFMFLINKEGFIEYNYWYDSKDVRRSRISYDEYGNFYYHPINKSDVEPWEKVKYDRDKIISIWRETYHYVDPERYNPPVIYYYKYDGDKVKKIDVVDAANDTLIEQNNFIYDENGRLVAVKSKYDENVKISYSGDTIRRESNQFFTSIVISDDVIVCENSGERDSALYRSKWKNPNDDYLFFEKYIYLQNGLLDKVVRTNKPSGEESVIYFRYKFYDG